MSENLHFDQFVKEKLSNQSAEVPDRIWDNIVALRRQSRPKGFWFGGNSGLLLSIGIVLLAILSGYFLLSTKNGALKVHPSPTVTKATLPNSTLLNNDMHNQVTTESKTGRGLTDDTFDNPAIGNVVTNKTGINSGHGSPGVKTNVGTTEVGMTATDKNAISSIQKPLAGNQNVINEIHGKPAIALSTTPFNLNPNTISSTYFNPSNARELTPGKTLTTRASIFVGCPTIEKNAAGNKKYWEMYAGPDYIIKNYKTFGDTASYNYLQKRKASTEFSSAFSAGVRYTRVFNNGMSARTGVNFSQVNEKFNYVNPNELKFVTVITRRVVVRAPGDTLYFNDTLQYQQSGTHVRTTYNHYRNIDIPVVIGYELGNGKIHANINAGVIINIYSWYKGDVLDTSYQPVTITTGKGANTYQYKTNIGVGFLGSFSLYYKINDKMHILLEPYFRYNLSPMSKENLNLQQKYHTVGVRAGIRLDLQ